MMPQLPVAIAYRNCCVSFFPATRFPTLVCNFLPSAAVQTGSQIDRCTVRNTCRNSSPNCVPLQSTRLVERWSRSSHCSCPLYTRMSLRIMMPK